MVAHELAVKCGLDVPEAKLEKYSKKGSTFLTKRFDREIKKRIHFSSAMTMIGRNDGEDGSYLEIASFLKSQGAAPKVDLKELWCRIVFNMAISNIDDHLRNHGFILEKEGWRLSPMYDVNPVPYGNSLSLYVDETDNTIDLDLALSVANQFGLKQDEAKEIIGNILKVVSDYKDIAKGLGISRGSIEYMEPAFMNRKQ